MATDFIAGCAGGAAGVIVGHPLDTVKVRLQTQRPDNIRYRGTFHALFKIAKQESVAGLYKGMSSPLYGVSLVNAIIFGVYGSLQPFVTGAPGNNALWAHALAGSIAGSVQSVVCSPMELVKIRMQLNESSAARASSWSVLKNIYKSEGGLRKGLFKGWGVTLSREIPGFGSYFASYEALISHFESYDFLLTKAGQVGTAGMMMAGGCAGCISWLACFPMDVIKTRFQSDVSGAYSGILDCARKTYQAEGYRVFTRTLPSVLIRAFPMNAVTFPVVTWVMRLADEKHDDLQTSRQEIDKLLEEWDRTKARTQETLYQLHMPVPTYRMLTEHGTGTPPHAHTSFSAPGTGYFDTARYSSAYTSKTSNKPIPTWDEVSAIIRSSDSESESNLRILTSQHRTEKYMEGNRDTELNPEVGHSRLTHLILDENQNSESPGTTELVRTSGNGDTTLGSILRTWFLEFHPTPVHLCNCFDECVCCTRSTGSDR